MKRLISISAPLFLAVFVLGFPPDPPFLDEYDVNTQPAYELTVPYTMKITRKGLNAAGLITLILRLRSYAAVACFDALAAYHPTATGKKWILKHKRYRFFVSRHFHQDQKETYFRKDS